MQRIMVIQRGNAAQSKVDWIRKQARDIIITKVLTLKSDLPEVIDDPSGYLPAVIEAELLLDYTRHIDLTIELVRRCHEKGCVVVASGSKARRHGLFAPATCCSLSLHPDLGAYGRQFGAPDIEVTVEENRIASVSVLRGSPCGSTWQAAKKLIGMPAGQAPEKFGLCVQMLCGAKPSGWDPIHAGSPVHTAGRIHAQALSKALRPATSK